MGLTALRACGGGGGLSNRCSEAVAPPLFLCTRRPGLGEPSGRGARRRVAGPNEHRAVPLFPLVAGALTLPLLLLLQMRVSGRVPMPGPRRAPDAPRVRPRAANAG